MKKVTLLISLLFVSTQAFPKGKSEIKDSHSTIYTAKIIRIVNALNVGEFDSDDQYFKMLNTACKRNKCTSLETQTVQSVGQQIVYCQIKHLKSHGIENSDATALCESKQAIFGCDSLPKPLLRKMCYTGNKYSLKTWQEKEIRLRSKKRMPASLSK